MRPLTPEETENQKRESAIHWWATGSAKHWIGVGAVLIASGVTAIVYGWSLLVSLTWSSTLVTAAGVSEVTGIAYVCIGVRLVLAELLDWYRYVHRSSKSVAGLVKNTTPEMKAD